MNNTDEIKKLENTKDEIIKFISELDEKLKTKQINRIEYHLILQEKLCGKNKDQVLNYINEQITELENKKQETEQTKTRNTKLIAISAAAIIIVIIAIIGIITTDPNALTGYIVKSITTTEDYTRTFEHNTETQLELQNITSLKITGTLKGTKATVKIRTETTEYLIGEITNNIQTTTTQEYSLKTDKTIYALGETASIIITPELNESTVSIYVQHNENNNLINNKTYTPNETGEYSIITIITTTTDIIRLETNITVQETVQEGTIQTDNTATQTITQNTSETQEIFNFENICTETCTIPETNNPTLIIELEENTTITITNITTTKNKENIAPIQTQNIPDITITKGQAATINLDQYFSDTDDNTIYYETNTITEITTTTEQNTLTISSETPGSYQMYVYASDENQLITSNTFTINVIEQQTTNTTENQTNTTINETTLNETNITLNETTNNTINETINTTTEIPVEIDQCTNPDLNLRPAYCYENIEDKVFHDIIAPLENPNGEILGRINKFGNLIIKGLLIQDATGIPSAEDFKIGYSEINNFDETTTYTSWIDQTTGNLYVTGKLYEEQQIIIPPQNNVYSIKNKFGIILGYFDTHTGDLYLKGNIVQLGKI